MPLILGLVLLILAEISLYVTIGGAIGLPATLAEVLGSGILGALILRAQGRSMVDRLMADAKEQRNPLRTAGDGVLQVLAGILLILPGFLTDTLGLVLLIPAVRQMILRRIAHGARQGTVRMTTTTVLRPRPERGTPVMEGEILEGTAQEVPKDPPPPPGPMAK